MISLYILIFIVILFIVVEKKELMNVFRLYVLIFIVMLFICVVIIFRYYKYGYLY